MNPLRVADRLLFAPMSPAGFGLLRAAWGAVTFLSVLLLLPERQTFFSEQGLLPMDLASGVLRDAWRFSLLDGAGTAGVDVFFAVLLAASACTALGIAPRLSTALSVVLLWSLHERNVYVFAGGDTVLRLLGFILLVAPSLEAFSLKRLRRRMRTFGTAAAGALPRVPSYAYRLLLWQLIVLYGCSLFEKLSGDMWLWGTATESVLHHPVFTRAPLWATNLLTPISAWVTWATLAFHALWLLLLVPKELTDALPRFVPRLRLKRVIVLLGILFHGGILLVLDAGDFSLAMFAAYLGLLDDSDLATLRTLWNWKWKGAVTVLYDGSCRFCTRSAGFLDACDWGGRLAQRDFRTAAGTHGIDLHALDRALHIVLPDGRILAGFPAFRELCEHLPPLLPLVPFLWLPGMETAGSAVYSAIAKRRSCIAGHCKT